MKKFILSLILLLYVNPAYAVNWMTFKTWQNTTMDVDIDSIYTENSYIYYNYKEIVGQNTPYPIELISYNRIDCNTNIVEKFYTDEYKKDLYNSNFHKPYTAYPHIKSEIYLNSNPELHIRNNYCAPEYGTYKPVKAHKIPPISDNCNIVLKTHIEKIKNIITKNLDEYFNLYNNTDIQDDLTAVFLIRYNRKGEIIFYKILNGLEKQKSYQLSKLIEEQLNNIPLPECFSGNSIDIVFNTNIGVHKVSKTFSNGLNDYYKDYMEKFLTSAYKKANMTLIQPVTISLSLNKDGTVKSVKVTENKNNKAYDKQIIEVIKNNAPFEPLMNRNWINRADIILKVYLNGEYSKVEIIYGGYK